MKPVKEKKPLAVRHFHCSRRAFLIGAVVLSCPALAVPSLAEGQSRLTATLTLPIREGGGIRFWKLPGASGLSQTRVSNIVQDDQGFIWFGTQNGLNRFDGYTCKVFHHDRQNPNSLSGVYIHALFKDRSGFIWVGSDQFLDRFDPATESFTRFPLTTSNINGPSVVVTDISQDSSGLLWLSTNNGLFRLDPATGHSTRFLHNPRDPTTVGDDDIKSTGEDREGRFWVATSRSLDQLNRTTGKVVRHIDLPYSGLGAFFHEDRSGVFWVVYGDDGLPATLDLTSGKFTRYRFSPYSRIDRLNNRVYAMAEDHDGNMWFGAENGVVEFDHEHHYFVSYVNHMGDSDSLTDNRVAALFVDRDDTIWVGLHQAGPNFFTTKHPSFEKVTYMPGAPSSLRAPLVSALYVDRGDVLWVGTDRGVTLINLETDKYSTFGPIDNSRATVLSILEQGRDTLWFGTGQGLKQYDRRTSELKGYLNPGDFASSNCQESVVERMLLDRAGMLWGATWDGLCRFDAPSGQFSTYKPDQNSHPHYNAIALDNNGDLWLGGDIGLDRFDLSTKSFTVYRHDPDDPRSLSDSRVNSIYFDHLGIMWVGTQNGLDKFDPTAKNFTAYGEDQGMNGNVVSCVLEDKRGSLWMSTNEGISTFNPHTNTFENYTVADGLPGPDLTGWGACTKSATGEMFFGGFSGLTAFVPEGIVVDNSVLPIVLTDFQLFGNSVRLGEHSILKEAITHTTQITLSHGQNMFAIEFSALNYLNSASIRYRYKLEGLDARWNTVDSDHRVAAYTTLPQGSYTFRVEAATSHGQWGESGATLRIQILPPWWESLWFLSMCIVFSFAVLWLLYLLRMNQVTADVRTRMEERLDERERIACELHDTLLQGALSASIQLDLAEDQLAKDSPIRGLVQNVLATLRQVTEEGRMALRGLRFEDTENNDLAKVFQRVKQEFPHKGTIVFRVVAQGAARVVRTEILNEIYRIGREAIVNAYVHSEAATIEVEIQYARTQLRLLVRDDGRGIDPSILQGGRDGHWGLSGMRERSRRIGATLKLRSKLGAGTEIELMVPGHIAFQDDSGKSTPRWLSWLGREWFNDSGRRARDKQNELRD
ncbi:MAG: two-component regulator propeller domain-containing protein [Terracidiphilus sp.]|jgi:ligand-binding sensor domain-containing protein/signal transduction histidine kinase